MDASKNILITGASGLIGSRLISLLSPQHKIFQLSRSPKGANSYGWDVEKKVIDVKALINKKTVIHLAGAGVGDKRWTPERKEEILKSRTESTRLLFEQLKNNPHQVEHFISASAIGYYGFEDEESLHTEQSPPGNDFLATVTKAWEDEVDKIASLGIRVVKIRIGIVLSEKGGALKEIAAPVKYFVGAPIGSGKQPVSWIHIDDVCGIFIKAVNDTAMRGAYNAVAPAPVDNKTLTKAIGKALGRPVILPGVPAAVLRAVMGEMADIVVTGSKISPEKIISSGYNFKFTDIQSAVNDLLRRN